MKIFNTRFKVGKLIIAILIVITLLNFILVPVSTAFVGAELASVFLNLLVWIGDGALSIMENLVYGESDPFITVDFATTGQRVWRFIRGILVAIGIAALVILTGGVALAKIIPAAKILAAKSVAATGVITKIGAYGTIATGAAAATAAVTGAVLLFTNHTMPLVLQLPITRISPDAIFSDQVPLLSVNFFDPPEPAGPPLYDGDPGRQPLAGILRGQIGLWYQTLRGLAMVGLLSVLVYVGIRIMLSSTANEKAKYKNMIQGWLVAMCLLFVLHYIMVFSVMIVQRISSSMLDSSRFATGHIFQSIPGNNNDSRDLINRLTQCGGSGGDECSCTHHRADAFFATMDDGIEAFIHDDDDIVIWPTGFVGRTRIMLQLESYSEERTVLNMAAYTILYLALVFLTGYFLVFYIKRVIMLAFLTMIAPLITLTYPIDKIGDGKAQAFEFWLREYLFNLLIQPFHLLIYLLVVGSAMAFAFEYPIFAVVALAFMMPAENLLRSMFGFDKSSTTKAMSPVKAAALTMGGVKMISSMMGSGGNNSAKASASSQAAAAQASSGTRTGSPLNGGIDVGGLPVGSGGGNTTGAGAGAGATGGTGAGAAGGATGTPPAPPVGGAAGGATGTPTPTPIGGAAGGAPTPTPIGGAAGGATGTPPAPPIGGAAGGATGTSPIIGAGATGMPPGFDTLGERGRLGVNPSDLNSANFTQSPSGLYIPRGATPPTPPPTPAPEPQPEPPSIIGAGAAAGAPLGSERIEASGAAPVPEPPEEKKKPIRGWRGGLMSVAGATGRGLAGAAPKVARFGLKAVGAATVASLSAASNIAMGNIGQIPNDAIAGAALGYMATGKAYNIAGGIGNKVVDGAVAGGEAYVEGAEGSDSQRLKNLKAYRLAQQENFKKNAEACNPEMPAGELAARTYEMAHLSMSTGIGADGNKGDIKRLNEAAQIESELLSNNRDRAQARKQVEEALQLERHMMDKEFKKEWEQHREDIIQLTCDNNPGVNRRDVETRLDETYSFAERLHGKR